MFFDDDDDDDGDDDDDDDDDLFVSIYLCKTKIKLFVFYTHK